MKASHFADDSLPRLAELRNREIHQKGTPSSQRARMSFPEGIKTTSLILEMDFRSGPPVGRYKSAEMEEFSEHPVEYKWVWDVEGEPDVIPEARSGNGIMMRMPEPIKPIRVRMKVLDEDGLNAPLLAVMPSDRTYEMIVHATKQLSSIELHHLREDIDRKYNPHTKVDQIEQ